MMKWPWDQTRGYRFPHFLVSGFIYSSKRIVWSSLVDAFAVGHDTY
jgi:hypothetical protein